MLDRGESRDFMRMKACCEISYKLPDIEQVFVGECLNISGSGVLFIATQVIESGMALEVKIASGNKMSPPMIAYVEVIRVKEQLLGGYEVAAEIKGIKEY